DPFVYKPGAGYFLIPCDSLRPGEGYWVKSRGVDFMWSQGPLLNNLVIHTEVGSKWNLIGGIGRQMTIASIVENSTSVASNYFGYGKTGYYIANSGGPAPGKLIPGYGYWVKTNGAGTLEMNGNVEAAPKAAVKGQTNLDALNQVTVIDRFGRQQT